MTVQERLLALRLLERQGRDPDCMRRLGVFVRMEHTPEIDRNKEREKQYDV